MENNIETKVPFVGLFANNYQGEIRPKSNYNPIIQQGKVPIGSGPTVRGTICGMGEIDDEKVED